MPKSTSQPTLLKTFDLVRSPLKGFNLIDASAGTGKTYTICGLVLRLLLENNLTIEQILVVTYTEAATEDLRSRIRQKLRQALHAVNNPPGDDEFLQKYLATIKDNIKAAQRLSEALRSFDAAAIYTIHGFCQRMLLENSFESNGLFDTELITDDSHLTKEIVEDFWRRRISSQGSSLFSQYAADRINPDMLQNFLGPFMHHPFLQFIPDIEIGSGCTNFSESEKEYSKAYNSVCNTWAAVRKEVLHDLLNSQVLKRNIYKKANLPGLISAMDDMAAAGGLSLQLFKKFILFTSGRITAATKTKKTPNILPFYEQCENLMQARNNLIAGYDRCLLALKNRLLEFYRYELPLRKERDNVFSFNDLLRRLHEALSGPQGAAFARTLAQKYPAALIDEFQDTDPLQYEIFKTIYHERSLLFLIGDPKQAIYSFRGADIYTYMDAAAGSPLAHHTLGVNHRSTPALVKAINTFFSRSGNPFVFDKISFQPVYAAPKKDPEYLTIDGQQEEPFILWYLNGEEKSGNASDTLRTKKPRIARTAARRRIISWVTTEVCRLLSLASEGRMRINKKKLLPGDIAILVRNNDEARKMQQALLASRVASVLHSGEDLFASVEAKEMLLLLNAIVTPGNMRRVKAGLLTCFIGLHVDAINLHQGNRHENGKHIELWLTKFRKYHELWNRNGFMQMFWTVIQENRVRQRLLASENGERSLTNILHLAEILNQEAVNQGHNMTAVLRYMQDRLADKLTKNTEHQLRLESDEDRVKIVTIHKAKGLEYPVVFCPFTWEGSRLNPKKGCFFHQQRHGKKTELFFDAGTPELGAHLHIALQEELAENLRLLYVALTRAVHRCYLIWGPINGAETSAPAYLLHHGLTRTANLENVELLHDNFIQTVADRFSGLSDLEILAELQELAAAAEGTIRVTTEKNRPGAGLLHPKGRSASLRYREFTGSISRDWKISSFSSLTANKSAIMPANQALQDMVPDRDAVSLPLIIPGKPRDAEESSYDIYSFPHGARPGTLLHELLEQADFCNEQPVAEHLIHEKLHYFGYETTWAAVIKKMLDNLGNVRLHHDMPDLKLSNIAPENCLHELEFYFPLSRVTPDDVKYVFSTQDLNGSADIKKFFDKQLDRLTFAPTRGFMRGFVDLVFEFQGKFYLADWKSNYLGSHIENYHQDKLLESILSGFYFLQYHIYSLALHLYLENRIPGYIYENHFGGVFYVFLRGVDQNLGPDYGIYHDLPSSSFMEVLSETFIAGRST